MATVVAHRGGGWGHPRQLGWRLGLAWNGLGLWRRNPCTKVWGVVDTTQGRSWRSMLAQVYGLDTTTQGYWSLVSFLRRLRRSWTPPNAHQKHTSSQSTIRNPKLNSFFLFYHLIESFSYGNFLLRNSFLGWVANYLNSISFPF